MAIRLVMADDHPLILNALENLFQLEPDIEVVACCKDGVEAMDQVRCHQPDVLILDIRMPGKDGLQVARDLRAEKIPTRVIILAADINEEQLLDAIHMGVKGVVLKEMAPKLLVQCIRKVHDGGSWIERDSERHALEKLMRREQGTRDVASVLTASELNVVRLVATGVRNKEIAGKLYISEGTVKVHLHRVYEKLRVGGRLALLRFVHEKGLV